MTNEEIIAPDSGLTSDNAESIREELSEGFTKANSLSELEQKAPKPVEDQPQGGENGEDKSDDSIGLSDDKKSPSDDASDDRGEEDGGSASTSAPADEKADDDKSSPFTTVEDEELDDKDQPASKPEEDVVSEEVYFEELSNKVGYEVTSEEELVSLVRHLAEKDPLEGLSPLLKKAAEFESNGGDVREYFNVLSVNTDSLSNKEALWHKFKSSNSSLAQENNEFARQKFERDFNTKYKILSDQRVEDDFDTPEEFRAYQQEKAYAQQELEWESSSAKKDLAAERDEALASAPAKAQIDESAQQEMYDKYMEDASYYKSNFETLQIPIDADGKTSYNIGLNEQSRPMFERWMDNPTEFLDYIGIGSDQKSIDAESLASNMALIAAFSVDGDLSVGAQFAKAMTERINRNTVESRLENPAPEGGKSNSGGEGGQSELQEAIEAFRDDVVKQRRR